MNSLNKCKCAFPLEKQKKYNSFTELLFDRKICNTIERGNTRLPYRDTQERLNTLISKYKYSKQLDKSGRAYCTLF